jgi:hypothetical protein
LPGCKTAIVEEEYEGKVWYKLEVSWATWLDSGVSWA